MDELTQLDCEECAGKAKLLCPSEIISLLYQVPDWDLAVEVEEEEEKLTRVFKIRKYAQALKFTNVIAELAESEGHHPQILLEYGQVSVAWWTHTLNGLHINDFILAARTTKIFAADYV
ncbi:MAG: hypothetical protein OFPII_26870 [Osedax symbiont Rs1]|nr:MAG: hypothetical protein OFPII_26870 [Osedax symbiont Rs1]